MMTTVSGPLWEDGCRRVPATASCYQHARVKVPWPYTPYKGRRPTTTPPGSLSRAMRTDGSRPKPHRRAISHYRPGTVTSNEVVYRFDLIRGG